MEEGGNLGHWEALVGLIRRGLGPHSAVAAACVATGLQTLPEDGFCLRYPTADGRMTVSVDPDMVRLYFFWTPLPVPDEGPTA